jgi:hypothetical protein
VLDKLAVQQPQTRKAILLVLHICELGNAKSISFTIIACLMVDWVVLRVVVATSVVVIHLYRIVICRLISRAYSRMRITK